MNLVNAVTTEMSQFEKMSASTVLFYSESCSQSLKGVEKVKEVVMQSKLFSK